MSKSATHPSLTAPTAWLAKVSCTYLLVINTKVTSRIQDSTKEALQGWSRVSTLPEKSEQ